MSKTVKFLIFGVLLIVLVIILLKLFFLPKENKPSTTPIKIKAQSRTYSKYISFNRQFITPTTIPTSRLITPTTIPTSRLITPTTIPTIAPISIASPTLSISPTPTEIIIARISPSPLLSSTPEVKTVTLPKSGVIKGGLIFSTIALLTIFFSFWF